MASYEKAGETDEWFTPRYLFEALGERFDVDVAAPIEGPRHVPCDRWYYERSLEREWRKIDFIWMNPPFGHQSTKRAWLAKFVDHGNGIALLPDRTSAPWWQEFAPKMDAIQFISPKIKFERPDGRLGESPGTGTCLFAKGERATRALLRAPSLGFVMLANPGAMLTNLGSKHPVTAD